MPGSGDFLVTSNSEEGSPGLFCNFAFWCDRNTNIFKMKNHGAFPRGGRVGGHASPVPCRSPQEPRIPTEEFLLSEETSESLRVGQESCCYTKLTERIHLLQRLFHFPLSRLLKQLPFLLRLLNKGESWGGGLCSGASPGPQVTTLPFRCDGLQAATLPAAFVPFLFLKPESTSNFILVFFLNLDWKSQTAQMTSNPLEILKVSSWSLPLLSTATPSSGWLAVQATVAMCAG